jgi:hypothetical protein
MSFSCGLGTAALFGDQSRLGSSTMDSFSTDEKKNWQI